MIIKDNETHSLLWGKIRNHLAQILYRTIFVVCLYLSYTYSQIQGNQGISCLVLGVIFYLFALENKIDQLIRDRS